MLRLVMPANSRRDETPVLPEIRGEIEELKVLVRLGHDGKAFANANSFEHASRLVVEIAKQNEGWIKSASCPDRGRSRQAMPAGLAAPRVR